MTKHKVKFKKVKIQESRLLVQNLTFSGGPALKVLKAGHMTKHKVKFKKLKIEESRLLVQNLTILGDPAMENEVSPTDQDMTRNLIKSYPSLTKSDTQIQVLRVMTTGHDSKLEKLPSLLSSGQYCKSVLQSGEAPLRDSMVGDFKHPRKYRITSPINMGGGEVFRSPIVQTE